MHIIADKSKQQTYTRQDQTRAEFYISLGTAVNNQAKDCRYKYTDCKSYTIKTTFIFRGIPFWINAVNICKYQIDHCIHKYHYRRHDDQFIFAAKPVNITFQIKMHGYFFR